MTKTQKYGIGLAMMTGCILIICLKMLQNKLFVHEVAFWWAVGACLFFCIYEWIAINLVETKKQTDSPRQSVNLFMGLKAGKIILSIFFALIYVLVVKVEVMRFVSVFVTLYLVFLAFDTIFLVYCESEAKKMNNSKKK
jgi:phosphatidylserine synthase